jgi:hypothetical protein
MYKIVETMNGKSVTRSNEDGSKTSIPFVDGNTDYANFKKEVLAGAELQDAEGNVMTAEQAQDFIKELP